MSMQHVSNAINRLEKNLKDIGLVFYYTDVTLDIHRGDDEGVATLRFSVAESRWDQSWKKDFKFIFNSWHDHYKVANQIDNIYYKLPNKQQREAEALAKKLSEFIDGLDKTCSSEHVDALREQLRQTIQLVRRGLNLYLLPDESGNN